MSSVGEYFSWVDVFGVVRDSPKVTEVLWWFVATFAESFKGNRLVKAFVGSDRDCVGLFGIFEVVSKFVFRVWSGRDSLVDERLWAVGEDLE